MNWTSRDFLWNNFNLLNLFVCCYSWTLCYVCER